MPVINIIYIIFMVEITEIITNYGKNNDYYKLQKVRPLINSLN